MNNTQSNDELAAIAKKVFDRGFVSRSNYQKAFKDLIPKSPEGVKLNAWSKEWGWGISHYGWAKNYRDVKPRWPYDRDWEYDEFVPGPEGWTGASWNDETAKLSVYFGNSGTNHIWRNYYKTCPIKVDTNDGKTFKIYRNDSKPIEITIV